MDVIVLDGNQRSSLAAVRSLGQKGFRVAVGEEVQPSIASRSRYARRNFLYPSPYKNSYSFIPSICCLLREQPGSVLLPMTDVTLSQVLKNEKELSRHVVIPFGDHNQYEAASDKVRLFRLARQLDVPIPETFFSDDFSELGSLVSKSSTLGFPVVIKPGRSRFQTANGWRSAGVKYAHNPEELWRVLESETFTSFPFLVQERIQGPGVGIFLLLWHGRVVARFAHRRIREKPPSGGVSVLCESVRPPSEALEAGERLLGHIGWTGPAMVEFKWDPRDNKPKLMEINARFWGSLQLAISAGVDFPYLLYCLARGEKVNPPKQYKVGLRSRWELGDLDHLFIRLKHSNGDIALPSNAPSRPRVLGSFLTDFFRPGVRHEVFRPDDPGPFLFELKQYLVKELRVKSEE